MTGTPGPAISPSSDEARWQEARRLRGQHPRWVIIWLADLGQYRAYRRKLTLAASTPADLASQIQQIEQAIPPASPGPARAASDRRPRPGRRAGEPQPSRDVTCTE